MSKAAIRYAKAILDIATTNGNASEVDTDMSTMVRAISTNQELQQFLGNPTIPGNIKTNVLVEIFPSLQQETKNLLQLVANNKRFDILLHIAKDYNASFQKASGLEQVTVITAMPITTEIEAQVTQKLKDFTNNKITITNIVDENIIGGFILKIGDKQFNASVANKLQQLKREFSN
jgi:F-type H+-transporting ATPase subunit delta